MNSAQTLARDIALELQANLRAYLAPDGPGRGGDLGTVQPEAEPRYLLGMCEQVIANCDSWPATKCHRWVGYVQGAKVALGLTTVEFQKSIVTRLREFNEDL